MNISMVDLRWKDLYRIAGIAAIISELVILLGFVMYFIFPYAPGTQSTESIFRLLQSNPHGGMIALDLFLFIGNLFSIALFLALYVSLKGVNESYALIALVIGLIGLVLLIPSRPLSELYTLSGLYASATTAAAKSQYLASGDTLLVLFSGTNWFMNTLLGTLSLLISALLMLRSNVYSKATAWVGIATSAITLGFWIPRVGIFLLFLSLPGMMILYFMLARRFFQLARGN
jgi:hypothetical protein